MSFQPIELKIFKKSKSFWGKITFSQYLFLLSVTAFCLLTPLLAYLKLSIAYLAFLLFPLILSFLMSITEYEKLNGEVIGKLILFRDFLKINGEQYSYNSIKSFDIVAENFNGKRNRINPILQFPQPFYLRGKGNHFRLLTNNHKEFSEEFLIENEIQIVEIYELYAHLVFSEVLKVDLNKLYNLPDKLKKNSQFNPFIEKLLFEKRIDCGYGLALLGYKSDSEAQLMRKKFCC